MEAFFEQNSLAFALLACVVVVCVYLGIKYGRVKIKTDKFAIEGESRENERMIIQRQLDWLYDAVFAFENKIPTPKGYNEFRGRYILAMLYIDMTEWVLYNHIEESKFYIQNKQSKIWNKAQTMIEKDELKSPEFKKLVNDYIKDIIHNLILIRKEYEQS